MRCLYAKWLAWLTLLFLLSSVSLSVSAKSPSSPDDLLPIIFVHGSSGSAAQFETHAMRFSSNGYPEELLYVFEYDTSRPFDDSDEGNEELVLDQLDAFISKVLEETGAESVNTIGHSRGTSVMTTYLDTVAGASEKVARYVNIDGRAPSELPGGVPTIGIWGEWNSGGEYARRPELAQIGPHPEDNFYFPTKAHTEVATSAEAFALMYEFFTGTQPKTTDVLPEPPGQVTIAGRVTLFPQNTGFEDAVLELWHVDPATGQRISQKPRASLELDETGAFGPFKVNGKKTYELAVTRPDGSVHHFYQEPFVRSNHFLRLQTGHAGSSIDAYVPKSESHAALTVIRQRELWGDQGHLSDQLTIDGLSVLTEEISPREDVIIAVYAFDSQAPGTDLAAGVPFPFSFISFLTAADVLIPATTPPTDIVEVALISRDSKQRSVVNVPNWPSSEHRITVQFRDYLQEDYAFTEYPRGQRKK